METTMQNVQERDWRKPLWLATLAAASVATSLGLACAVPLAAFAALGALTMDRRSALIMIALVVLANQVIGFTILHYPRDPGTFAWGAAFLLAGVTATSAAFWVKERCAGINLALGLAATFLVAFVAYEGTFFIVSAATRSMLDAYTPAIISRIFEVNLSVFGGLLLVNRIALALHLGGSVIRPPQSGWQIQK
jgi:hypothetical protein